MQKWAMVFPGQGSQSLGMLKDIAEAYPQVQETFACASTVLGYDLWQVVQENKALLDQTCFTQPALLTASIALWQIWQAESLPHPHCLAGHSLGEYTALVCAKALEFEVAVKLVAERGRLMQQAVPEGQGAMAAIVGLTKEQVQEICEMAADNDVVAPANFNADGQIVIAGHKAGVLRAVELAKQQQAKLAMVLAVSVPSHCHLMQPAAQQLAQILEKTNLQKPQIPVFNNVDVMIEMEPSAIKNALIQQLSHPVRWVDTIRRFAEQDVQLIVECGPGKVLAGLHKRIIPTIPTLSMGDAVALQNTMQQFK